TMVRVIATRAFPFQLNQSGAEILHFDAFCSREPWPTPPENAFVDQATLSFTTHSGGRDSPAPRSGAKRYSVEQYGQMISLSLPRSRKTCGRGNGGWGPRHMNSCQPLPIPE